MSAIDQHNLALLAELVTPAVRADNVRLTLRNKELLHDIKQIVKTCRDLADNNLNLQDHVRYLEGITDRLLTRVNNLEESILDCPAEHPGSRRVRRRLTYGSDNEVFETIDLETDEDI